MYSIAFRSGRDGDLVYGARPEHNEEIVMDDWDKPVYRGNIGSSFTDFISKCWDDHPYFLINEDNANAITTDSLFLQELIWFVDLSIDNQDFYKESCLTFFLSVTNTYVPPMKPILVKKAGHEYDAPENYIPEESGMSLLERKMRGFLSHGSEIYDVPLTSYTCELIEDACVATLHFLISHNIPIRKCQNCGKYFVAYKRADAIYCDRRSPFNPDRTCKQDGAQRKYVGTSTGNDLSKKIHNVTSARRMRVKRHPDDEEMRKELDNWLDQLKERKLKYKRGEISAEAFIEWLDDTKHYNIKSLNHLI